MSLTCKECGKRAHHRAWSIRSGELICPACGCPEHGRQVSTTETRSSELQRSIEVTGTDGSEAGDSHAHVEPRKFETGPASKMPLKNYLFLTQELNTLKNVSAITAWPECKEIRAMFDKISKNQNSSPQLTQIALDGSNYLELVACYRILTKNRIIDNWNTILKINDDLEAIECDPNSNTDCKTFAELAKAFFKLKRKLDSDLDIILSIPNNFKLKNDNQHIKDNLLKTCLDPSSTPSQLFSTVMAATCVINALLKVKGINLKRCEDSGQQIKDFEIGFTPVTSGEYEDVRLWANFNGFDIAKGSAKTLKHPITGISWFDAVKWCNAKSLMEGLKPVYGIKGTQGFYQRGQCDDNNVYQKTEANGYSLPTGEGWEWAARGGRNSKGYTFAGSNTLDNVGWYSANSKGSAQAVGMKVANEIGLYDMSGNVWEWCWNLDGNYRRICGGSWDDRADKCVISNSHKGNQREGGNKIGFRLARKL